VADDLPPKKREKSPARPISFVWNDRKKPEAAQRSATLPPVPRGQQPAANRKPRGWRFFPRWDFVLLSLVVFIGLSWKATGAVPRASFLGHPVALTSTRSPGPGKGASKNKTKKKGTKKQFTQKTTDRLSFFFFLGAPCVGCGPSVDMPPHVGTRSWLWGLPLRASSL
jgi:hypothetical protein